MDESRRSFLKKAGRMGLGLGVGLPLLGPLSCTARRAAPGQAPARQWGLVIDIQKCRREELRRACQTACHRAHNVPAIPDPKREVKWIWSAPFDEAFPDQAEHPYTATALQEQPVLVLCNHCTSPACVRVCPTQATWKRAQDGVVMMDMHRCIGCRYCIAACPYGARSFNWQDPRPFLGQDIDPNYPTRAKGVVEKCNFCVERLADGRAPACVAAAREAPGGEGALTFGDLSDPDSDVRRLLREKTTICRHPGLGTGPNVFYIV
ncbi:MAG: sulfate reduction electron transfer complex DsrMKJOP subunit DsrO [Planctomycetota bacterium]